MLWINISFDIEDQMFFLRLDSINNSRHQLCSYVSYLFWLCNHYIYHLYARLLSIHFYPSPLFLLVHLAIHFWIDLQILNVDQVLLPWQFHLIFHICWSIQIRHTNHMVLFIYWDRNDILYYSPNLILNLLQFVYYYL